MPPMKNPHRRVHPDASPPQWTRRLTQGDFDALDRAEAKRARKSKALIDRLCRA